MEEKEKREEKKEEKASFTHSRILGSPLGNIHCPMDPCLWELSLFHKGI